MSKTSIILAALIGLTAGALAAHADDHANHGDYEYALSDSQSECRVTNPPDKNGRGAFDRCIQITMHDRYGYGTPPDTNPGSLVPAGETPWGIYRDTESAANALGDTK